MSVRKIIGGIIILLLFANIFVFDFLSYPRRLILGDRQNREERDRAALEAENQTLALRVAELERRTPVSVQGKVFSPAPLFSTYPFNYRNLLMIGIGDRDGVSIGDLVAG